jgi:hypothetical protein
MELPKIMRILLDEGASELETRCPMPTITSFESLLKQVRYVRDVSLRSCGTNHLLTSAFLLTTWIDVNRTIVDMEADGNCLFRALSDQLYMDFGNMHADIRSDIADYLEAFEADFSSFLVLEDEDEDAADFESYVHSMRQDGEWGGNLELVAAARLYW